jgi:hypothetical protein
MLLADVVRKVNSSCWPTTGAFLVPREPSQGIHVPAKKNGFPSGLPNQRLGFGDGPSWYSQNAPPERCSATQLQTFHSKALTWDSGHWF